MTTIRQLMERENIGLEDLIKQTGFERRIVSAIVENRYTPSPFQRERIAGVFGVSVDEISWSNQIEVDHMYGHGPQFGRSP